MHIAHVLAADIADIAEIVTHHLVTNSMVDTRLTHWWGQYDLFTLNMPDVVLVFGRVTESGVILIHSVQQ